MNQLMHLSGAAFETVALFVLLPAVIALIVAACIPDRHRGKRRPLAGTLERR